MSLAPAASSAAAATGPAATVQGGAAGARSARARRSPAAQSGSRSLATSAGIQPSPSSAATLDRKSTRLNSSHVKISYAVFCLKKKTPPHHVPLANQKNRKPHE